MKRTYTYSVLVLVLSLIAAISCSKKEELNEGNSNVKLEGEWILESSFNDNDPYLDEIENYGCNNIECHSLKFLNEEYKLKHEYEDFTIEYKGEFKVIGNELEFPNSQKGFEEYDYFTFEIYGNASDEEATLIIFCHNTIENKYENLILKKEAIY